MFWSDFGSDLESDLASDVGSLSGSDLGARFGPDLGSDWGPRSASMRSPLGSPFRDPRNQANFDFGPLLLENMKGTNHQTQKSEKGGLGEGADSASKGPLGATIWGPSWGPVRVPDRAPFGDLRGVLSRLFGSPRCLHFTSLHLSSLPPLSFT